MHICFNHLQSTCTCSCLILLSSSTVFWVFKHRNVRVAVAKNKQTPVWDAWVHQLPSFGHTHLLRIWLLSTSHHAFGIMTGTVICNYSLLSTYFTSYIAPFLPPSVDHNSMCSDLLKSFTNPKFQSVCCEIPWTCINLVNFGQFPQTYP